MDAHCVTDNIIKNGYQIGVRLLFICPSVSPLDTDGPFLILQDGEPCLSIDLAGNLTYFQRQWQLQSSLVAQLIFVALMPLFALRRCDIVPGHEGCSLDHVPTNDIRLVYLEGTMRLIYSVGT